MISQTLSLIILHFESTQAMCVKCTLQLFYPLPFLIQFFHFEVLLIYMLFLHRYNEFLN